MAIDSGFHDRLEWLADLMEISPDKRVRDLQRSALKLYPLYYQEGVRMWMHSRIAFMAADIVNKRRRLSISVDAYTKTPAEEVQQ